jgi:hypothetical protein
MHINNAAALEALIIVAKDPHGKRKRERERERKREGA